MMTLRQMVLVDLQAWCDPERDVADLADRIANQLEAAHGRADCLLPEGRLAWSYDEQQRALTVQYPSGAERVRTLYERASDVS